MRQIVFLMVAWILAAPAAADELSMNARVERAMFGEHRSEANIARNRYRHPVATLEFFGLAEGQSVLEIWPGGGWYTEILAPVLRKTGKLTIASWDQQVEGQPAYRYELPRQLLARFQAKPEIYDAVSTVEYSPPQSSSLGTAQSYDLVLTFRNVHGWITSGHVQETFDEFARVLKPGGVLGVVQHRAHSGSAAAETAPLGYVSEEAVISFAEAAGLVFEAGSEVNANPRDTKDYPDGVWTLPPSFELGDTDRERYAAIGESDRMTLRFRKPRQD